MTFEELFAHFKQSDAGREMIRRYRATIAKYLRHIDQHVANLRSHCPVVLEVTDWNLFDYDCRPRQEVQDWIIRQGDDRWDWFHAGSVDQDEERCWIGLPDEAIAFEFHLRWYGFFPDED
jgi:hypothetical protein